MSVEIECTTCNDTGFIQEWVYREMAIITTYCRDCPAGEDRMTDQKWEDWERGHSEGDERACRVCGCTEDNVCEGGSWWAEDDLCSACVVDDKQARLEMES